MSDEQKVGREDVVKMLADIWRSEGLDSLLELLEDEMGFKVVSRSVTVAMDDGSKIIFTEYEGKEYFVDPGEPGLCTVTIVAGVCGLPAIEGSDPPRCLDHAHQDAQEPGP